MPLMHAPPSFTHLTRRAVVAVGGLQWQGFLQGLLTQDVETLGLAEIRFCGLLNPQGRLLFDLFVVGGEDGCLIDCAAEHREALIDRLTIYKLRAQVTIEASDAPVRAAWGEGAAPRGFSVDPRTLGLGWRGYDAPTPEANRTEEAAYEAHVISLGVPGPADWGVEQTYPIEANFDLLNGIDFRKGCFVGQETTSRMKRRGVIKSRMVPIAFDGPPPPVGEDVLAGTLRAGEVLSGRDGQAMALLRLDRVETGDRTLLDGRPWRPIWPAWMPR